MKKKILAAMALTVAVSAGSLTAYASVQDTGTDAAVSLLQEAAPETDTSGTQEARPEAGTSGTQEATPEAGISGTQEVTPEAGASGPQETGAGEVSYTDGWNQVVGEDGKEYTVYYDEEAGAVKTGLFSADGAQYYAEENGRIVKDGFADVDGRKLYFGPDGKRVTEEGWITVGGASYYLMDSDSDGKGEVCIDGNYASNQDENSRWLIVDGGWYLLDAQDGHRMSGLQKNGNDLYYLDPEQNDKMFCSTNDTDGWKQLDGTWYFFRSWGGA